MTGSSRNSYPNLETLIEREAPKPGDDLRIARWVVPLVLTAVGCGVFVPLGVAISPLFFLGTAGLSLLGWTLGLIFHLIVKSISPSRALLRKRSKQLQARMLRLRNILGFEPALAPPVGEVLDEAARLYLKTVEEENEKDRDPGLWTEARIKAERAMEEAMARVLELSEPETAHEQEVELSKGWAIALIREMRALDRALEEHGRNERLARLTGTESDAIAGLREARVELERLDTAADELESNECLES